MNNELFMKIVSAIITILIALITYFVKELINSRLDAEQTTKLAYYVDMAVRCADQIYTPEQWEEKKLYVTSYITTLVNDTFKLTLTPQDIDVLIEGAVNQLRTK